MACACAAGISCPPIRQVGSGTLEPARATAVVVGALIGALNMQQNTPK